MKTTPAGAADLAVIGGGIVGAVCALRAQECGLRTVLIDEGRPMGFASFGNAGHIATEQVEPLANPTALMTAPSRLFGVGGALDLRWSGVGSWGFWALRYARASTPARAAHGRRVLSALLADSLPAWQSLAASLGQPGLVRADGHLLVWTDAASGIRGRRRWAAAATGTAVARAMGPLELGRIGTRIGEALAAGLAFSHTGQVRDVGAVRAAIGARFDALGGMRRIGRARHIDGGAVVLEAGERIDAGRILVAAGVGSARLLRGIGYRVPIAAERGYHLEGMVEADYDLPPLVFEEFSLIATRLGDRLRVSSFVELAGPDAPPDPRKWARLHMLAQRLGLPMRPPFSRWMGARPTLPDYLPALGRSRRAPGIFYAFGHQHLGLTLAAITGEIMAGLLREQGALPVSDAVLAGCDLERFGTRRTTVPARARRFRADVSR